jgi:integrase
MPHNFKIEYTPGTTALNLVEVGRLLAVLPARRAAVCAYIVATGADWKSVALAEKKDVSLRKGTVLVRGSKNRHRWRTIPILGPFRAMATQAVAAIPFAFWGNVRRDLAVACRHAHVTKVTPRDLRRTHGSILRSLGIEPHLIGKMLGHADSRMVERIYGQLPPDALAALMRARTEKPKAKAKKKPRKERS